MTTSIWDTDSTSRLATALALIDDTRTMRLFLRDVLTEKEIIEISARLQAAKMLRDGAKYTDIIATTKLSTRTVARISDWLKNGGGGYDAALEAIDTHHAHLSPARAE